MYGYMYTFLISMIFSIQRRFSGIYFKRIEVKEISDKKLKGNLFVQMGGHVMNTRTKISSCIKSCSKSHLLKQ